jgi:uncharacterized protein (DUF2141 family)
MTVSEVSPPFLRVAAFLLFASLAAVAAADAETLTVKVAGLHGTAGTVHVMVWNEPDGFPMQPEKAVARKVVPITGPRLDVVFSGLAKGGYAVAAYQDANGNGRLDRSMLGWPTEPVGASNGATGMMGPPKFKDAAFQLKQSGQSVDLLLK